MGPFRAPPRRRGGDVDDGNARTERLRGLGGSIEGAFGRLGVVVTPKTIDFMSASFRRAVTIARTPRGHR